MTNGTPIADTEAMKTLMALLLVMTLSGCATWSRAEMQPDHSYRIEATGENGASHAKIKKTAITAASNLCPNGYDKAAEFGEDTMFYTMIILCKDRASIRVTSPQ